MDLRLYPAPLRGAVTPPPSKSLLHRQLICLAQAGQFPAPRTPPTTFWPRSGACGPCITGRSRSSTAGPAAAPCGFFCPWPWPGAR